MVAALDDIEIIEWYSWESEFTAYGVPTEFDAKPVHLSSSRDIPAERRRSKTYCTFARFRLASPMKII